MKASKPPASTKRVPTRTSSSGKASTARRNWSVISALQHGVALGGARHRRQADEHARRAADALERAEREAPQLVALAGPGDEDPRLGHLRQQAGLVAARTVGAEVGHLGQLAVTELRCSPSSRPRSPCGLRPPGSLVAPAWGGYRTPTVQPTRRSSCNSARRGAVPQVKRLTDRSGREPRSATASQEALGAEQHPHLAEEPGRRVDAVAVGQLDHLAPDVEEHRRLAGVLGDERPQPGDELVGDGLGQP